MKLFHKHPEILVLHEITNQEWERVLDDIYLNILRSVHVSEAKLLMSDVGKKIPYKGMTRALMLETFPDWLPVSNTLTE